MPATNVLAPAPYPLRAELLLDAHLPLDAERIDEALEARGLRRKADHVWERSGTAFRRPLTGGEMRITQHAAPRQLDAALVEDASSWWDAAPASRHAHVIEVAIGSTETSATHIARIFVRMLAALVDLSDDGPAEVLGVLVGGTRLLPGGFVQQHARMNPPIGLLSALHIGKPGEGYAVRTSGLADLGLPDVEVAESEREVRDVAMMLQRWVHLLMTEGPQVLYDGARVGQAGERIHVTITPSRSGSGIAYRLTYAAEQGEVPAPDDGLETVVCPQCTASVRAAVMRVAFVPLLLKCPACGAGPVALLEQMLEGAGGGKVTLVIESADVLAIATLLADHDPAFDTVVEASDFLRANYANGRVEVTLLRVFATKLYHDAEVRFPQVRVTCDEALGVLKPDASIFHSPTSDTTMQDAMAAARASLPGFIARLESPQPGDVNFGIKFPFRDGDEVEHMWVSDVRRDGDMFVGIAEAEAQLVKNVVQGSEVRVPASEISDWGFSNGDRIHGNYTTRVMLDSLPVPMRRALAARLVPLG